MEFKSHFQYPLNIFISWSRKINRTKILESLKKQEDLRLFWLSAHGWYQKSAVSSRRGEAVWSVIPAAWSSSSQSSKVSENKSSLSPPSSCRSSICLISWLPPASLCYISVRCQLVSQHWSHKHHSFPPLSIKIHCTAARNSEMYWNKSPWLVRHHACQKSVCYLACTTDWLSVRPRSTTRHGWL